MLVRDQNWYFVVDRRSIMSRSPIVAQLQSTILHRRDLLRRSAVAASAGPAAALASRTSSLAMQAGPSEIGVAGPGQHAFEFAATVHQRGFEFEIYGFLTRVAGAEPSLLFATGDPTGRNAEFARLTLHGRVAATSRSIIGQVFNVNGEGELSVYLAERGVATPEAPEFFQTGAPVATFGTRIQNIVSVYAPQQGIQQGYGDAVIQSSEPFRIGDVQYQFASNNQTLRMTYSGIGSLLDPDLPESMVHVVGNALSLA
jgi:hypothetical protein